MIRQEQCDKVCRILDDVLANRPTERDSLIVAVQKAFDVLEQADTNCSEIPNNSDTISRQQAIDALKEKVFHNLSDEFYGAMQVLDELPSIQPEQRWIPVTERLPEDEYVLISKKPSKISGDKWCVAIAIRTADQRSRKVQWRDSGFGIIPNDKVLAWMPLPEPYQKGGEKK